MNRGQSLDLHWRDHARCPTTDDYIAMVDNKIGGLFPLMLRLMEAESPISLASNTALARRAAFRHFDDFDIYRTRDVTRSTAGSNQATPEKHREICEDIRNRSWEARRCDALGVRLPSSVKPLSEI